MSLGKRPFDKRDINNRNNDENKENRSPDQPPAKKRHILSDSKVFTGQTDLSKLQATLYAWESKAALQKAENKIAMQTAELQRIGLLPPEGRSMPDVRVSMQHEQRPFDAARQREIGRWYQWLGDQSAQGNLAQWFRNHFQHEDGSPNVEVAYRWAYQNGHRRECNREQLDHEQQKELASRMNGRVQQYLAEGLNDNPQYALDHILNWEFSREERQQYLAGENLGWRSLLHNDLNPQLRATRERITESQMHPTLRNAFRTDPNRIWEMWHSENMNRVFEEYPRLHPRFTQIIKDEAHRLWGRGTPGAWIEEGMSHDALRR